MGDSVAAAVTDSVGGSAGGFADLAGGSVTGCAAAPSDGLVGDSVPDLADLAGASAAGLAGAPDTGLVGDAVSVAFDGLPVALVVGPAVPSDCLVTASLADFAEVPSEGPADPLDAVDAAAPSGEAAPDDPPLAEDGGEGAGGVEVVRSAGESSSEVDPDCRTAGLGRGRLGSPCASSATGQVVAGWFGVEPATDVSSPSDVGLSLSPGCGTCPPGPRPRGGSD